MAFNKNRQARSVAVQACGTTQIWLRENDTLTSKYRSF